MRLRVSWARSRFRGSDAGLMDMGNELAPRLLALSLRNGFPPMRAWRQRGGRDIGHAHGAERQKARRSVMRGSAMRSASRSS